MTPYDCVILLTCMCYQYSLLVFLKHFLLLLTLFAKTIVQTTGELDFEILFNDADLLYSPMAYILFFSFAILMPILFLNLLVSKLFRSTNKSSSN